MQRGGSVNTVGFLAVPTTSPKRKGMSRKRVQINEPSASDKVTDFDEDGMSAAGVLIQPARLFEGDLGYQSQNEQDLLAYFGTGGKGSRPLQQPTQQTVDHDDLDVDQVDMKLDIDDTTNYNSDAGEINVSDVENGDETVGVEGIIASSHRKSTR